MISIGNNNAMASFYVKISTLKKIHLLYENKNQ